MRILLVSQYFWPENFRINDVAKVLTESGMDLTVLTGKPNYPDGKIFQGYKAGGIQYDQYMGMDVVRVPVAPRGKGAPWRLALNYLSFILAAYVFAPFALRGRRFDAVFVYAPSPLLQALPAIFIAWLKRAPLVVWVQDLWPESVAATGFIRNRHAIRVIEAVVRYIYRHTESILIQSEAFRAPVARLVRDAGKIHYYPNSADEIFCTRGGSEADAPGANGVIQDGFSVVFAGNLGTAQSLETILDAAEQLRDTEGIKIYIVGSGSRETWLAGEIQRRKIDNVILTGRFPLASMPAIFASASALMVTLRDEPIFAYTIPSKVQAYLAVGRPIIACLNGEGARVIEEAKAGFSCPAGNADELARAIKRLHSMSPEERDQLGVNGREYFRAHFEPRKLLGELIAHFDRVRLKYEEETK